MRASPSLALLALFVVPTSSAVTPVTPPCPGDQAVRLACTVKGGKVARFCQTPDGLSYAFGALGATPELALDQTALASRRTGPDSERVLFWARNLVKDEGMWRYTAVVDRTEDQIDTRLVIEKNGAPVTTLSCRDPVQADLTELDALEKAVGTAPRDLASWTGRWERLDAKGGADLTLTSGDDGLAVVGMSTLPIYETVHVAELQGVAGVATPTSEGPPTALQLKTHCTVDLTWVGPGEITVTDTGDCGGQAVTFAGRYRRAFGS